MFKNFLDYLQRNLLTKVYIGMEQVEHLTLKQTSTRIFRFWELRYVALLKNKVLYFAGKAWWSVQV